MVQQFVKQKNRKLTIDSCSHYYRIDACDYLVEYVEWMPRIGAFWNYLSTTRIRKKQSDIARAAMLKILEDFRDEWLVRNRWPIGDDHSPFDQYQAVQLLNPYKGNGACAFIDALITYPRMLDNAGLILIGGVPRIGTLQPPRNKDVPPEFAKEFETSGGSFDLAVQQFTDYVDWIGRRCNCPGAAVKAVGHLGALADWLKTNYDLCAQGFIKLEGIVDELKRAFLDLSVKVGDYCDPSAKAREAVSAPDPQVVESLDAIRIGIHTLRSDMEERKARNRQRGAANRKGRDDNADHSSLQDRSQAALDRATALRRIHERVTKGEKVLAACRHVCLHFTPIPGRKNDLGQTVCKPLVNEYGKEVVTETQFKTMARYYRERYNVRPRTR